MFALIGVSLGGGGGGQSSQAAAETAWDVIGSGGVGAAAKLDANIKDTKNTKKMGFILFIILTCWNTTR